MSELLFEIGTEEIPSGYLTSGAEGLLGEVTGRLKKLNISFDDARWFATPRRLAVSITGMPERRQENLESVYGPPKKVAFNEDGSLSKAGLGFAKSRGVDPADVKVGNTEKGEYVYVQVHTGGEKVVELISTQLSAAAAAIVFPKSMTWADHDLRFTRPIHWVAAMFAGEVVKLAIGHIESGSQTCGHRFLSPEAISVQGRSDYLEKLRGAYVVASLEERKKMVLEQARAAAKANGAVLVEDDDLAHTVACLVEWPVALWGSFDEQFLALPEELLVASMKNHQKMFSVRDADGKLSNGFIGVSNMIVEDDQVVVDGYRRVLRARLSDAKFFYDEDLKSPLESFVAKLDHVVYQKKLGTIGEKVNRFAALASHIALQVDPESAGHVERAARLCKADLETLMVYEFPELQGVMGREYARHAGEPEQVCQGIHESYMPRFSGDSTASGAAGAIVGIADRIDTLAGCFGIGLIPTGAQDPFALRRSAIGVIQTILDKRYKLSLSDLFTRAIAQYGDRLEKPVDETRDKLIDFFAIRLKNIWIGEGISHDLAEAVLSSGIDDLAGAKLRVEALAKLKERPFFIPLVTTFKRAANIVKDHSQTLVDPELLEEESEKVLYAEIKGVEHEALELENANYYLEALERLAGLRSAVDRLFDEVMILAEDEKIRNNRLAILSSVRGLFMSIADFSKIEA